MISIRDAMRDLERADQLRRDTLDCYVSAIKTAAQYAVELDDEITNPHRRHLNQLADDLTRDIPEALQESRATLRCLLRDYRDKASRYLNRLREELEHSISALQDTLNALNQSDGEHDTRLRHAVKTLRQIHVYNSVEAMRAVVVSTTNSIEESLEALRKQHQFTVAQFLSEIRALHQRIDQLENAAAVDSMTQIFNRAEMEKRIQGAREGAVLLLIHAIGIENAETQFGPEVSQELAGAFIRRLRNSLKPATICGRWGGEQFLAIGPPEKAEASAAGKWITDHLSGEYVCLLDGRAVRPSMDVKVAVVERTPGENAEPALAQVREHFGGSPQ